jgi:hypothetical protein
MTVVAVKQLTWSHFFLFSDKIGCSHSLLRTPLSSIAGWRMNVSTEPSVLYLNHQSIYCCCYQSERLGLIDTFCDATMTLARIFRFPGSRGLEYNTVLRTRYHYDAQSYSDIYDTRCQKLDFWTDARTSQIVCVLVSCRLNRANTRRTNGQADSAKKKKHNK